MKSIKGIKTFDEPTNEQFIFHYKLTSRIMDHLRLNKPSHQLLPQQVEKLEADYLRERAKGNIYHTKYGNRIYNIMFGDYSIKLKKIKAIFYFTYDGKIAFVTRIDSKEKIAIYRRHQLVSEIYTPKFIFITD